MLQNSLSQKKKKKLKAHESIPATNHHSCACHNRGGAELRQIKRIAPNLLVLRRCIGIYTYIPL